MNPTHKENYIKLQLLDKTSNNDTERKALFFILASECLYDYVLDIYDFVERSIKLETLNELDLGNGQRKMVELAFNLYNGNEAADPYELFHTLDQTNLTICLEAIKIRFNHF